MAATAPTAATLRSYNVGFGDCYLLSFRYNTRNRHLLIDFGSMSLPSHAGKGDYMERVARQIESDCDGQLDAVVATHRHRDHISGFTLKGKGANATGPGAIIRGLKPKVVVQPWTEAPAAKKDAQGPTLRESGTRSKALTDSQATTLYMRTLNGMHDTAQYVAAAAKTLSGSEFEGLRTQLTVIGMDNINNPEAVENLRTMAPNRYVHYGSPSGLDTVLPGVTTRVLGPPTIAQTREILKERSKDPNEFWLANAGFWQRQALTSRRFNAKAPPLFPRYQGARVPWDARWYRYYAMTERGESMLSIVRILDDAMNNTSVILLFKVKNTLLLFPGDAQYENWMYALRQPHVLELLKDVSVYKVGHHGSLNATPKTLWNAFSNKGPAKKPHRLATFLSSKQDVYGTREKHTEVPRSTLLNALKTESDLTDTQTYKESELVTAHTIELR